MGEKRFERDILWLFDAGLLVKAIHGALEILGAALILAIPPTLVMRLATIVTAGELSEDPGDIVAGFIQSSAKTISVSNHVVIAFYLILHGLLRVLLVVWVHAGKKIAYLFFALALAVFSGYEFFLSAVRQSGMLFALGSFDLLLMLLTLYEYHHRSVVWTAET